jgi:DNA-binding transcriptional ArsR family regulator
MNTVGQAGTLQNAFRALADSTRRDIMVLLSQRDMTIGEVSDHFAMTRAAVKKHLTVLQQGQMVAVEKRGRERINRLQPMALKDVSDWLSYFSRFWDDRLSDLQDAVAKQEAGAWGKTDD